MNAAFNKGLLLQFTLVIASAKCNAQVPGVRNGHAMVYFIPQKSIVLFGGADEKKVYGDTWSFANDHWKKIADVGPSPRTFPSMVMANNYILLFGGNAVLFGNNQNPGQYLDDTWKFENGKWFKLSLATHPDARSEAAITYDSIRKRVVLFGGRRAGERWINGDTWEFDGNEWREADTTGPAPRSGAQMVFDSRLKQIILFGGNPVIAKEKNYNGPMWSRNGEHWNQMNSQDSLIFNSCMAYNTIENFILRFGGWNGDRRVNDTWIYKKNGWEKLHFKIAPAARNHSIMIYDPNKNAFFLYGGHDGENVFGDLWQFKNGNWTLIYATKALKRLENGH
jgi:hypothetical protein